MTLFDVKMLERKVSVVIPVLQMEKLRHWVVCVFKSHNMAGIKIWQLDVYPCNDSLMPHKSLEWPTETPEVPECDGEC